MELIGIFASYIIGSIPFGLIFALRLCDIDPRTAGSCNVGSTNVARLCGKKYGIYTLIADILKGWLPVYVAIAASDSAFVVSLVALAVILGHVFSVFLCFKGGKAVATSVGVFAAIAFGPLLLAAILCIALICYFGYVSLGSLALVVSMPILLFLSGYWAYIPLSICIVALVFWSHRENIQRLICGEEKSWKKSEYKE